MLACQIGCDLKSGGPNRDYCSCEGNNKVVNRWNDEGQSPGNFPKSQWSDSENKWVTETQVQENVARSQFWPPWGHTQICFIFFPLYPNLEPSSADDEHKRTQAALQCLYNTCALPDNSINSSQGLICCPVFVQNKYSNQKTFHIWMCSLNS